MSAVDLLWPKSRTAIADIQRKRKRAAVEAAKRAPFYRGRLDGIDLDRLDDPEVWNRIPLLTKDELRTVPAAAFHDRFCVAPRSSVVEYWRSGGVTGRPLFYPRSADDMQYALLTFKRGLTVVGRDARGLRPHLVPARHPSGRASLCARRRRARHRHGVGGLRQQHAVGDAARAHRRAQADDLVRHGQLRAAPRQPGGGQGHRPRRQLGQQDRGGGGAAVARQAREARAHVGRAGVRPVRHDRRRPGLLRVGRSRRAAPVVRPVLRRDRRRGDRACRWPKARPGRW